MVEFKVVDMFSINFYMGHREVNGVEMSQGHN